jgi:hypothetical protein
MDRQGTSRLKEPAVLRRGTSPKGSAILLRSMLLLQDARRERFRGVVEPGTAEGRHKAFRRFRDRRCAFGERRFSQVLANLRGVASSAIKQTGERNRGGYIR